MNQGADDFRTRIPGFGNDDSAPADGRRARLRRHRSRNDTIDFVDSDRLSVFANLVRDLSRKTAAKRIAGAPSETPPTVKTRSSVRQQILSLLRQGVTYREIADHLDTPEKNIRRLARRSNTEAKTCPRS